ncbi:ABC-type metal ion transport system, permease component [Gottschalkia purinilytica]|uniref:ABC-type metal ion transport system, permease component n=1 Tax=Gottschalkia purinilytica TaxID=1503 RepID=A0A0L0WC67_GOTPU|nr:ABC transporter permease subunit [Gottschalkia purinilytica]KNF09069.1 ABC-type metal ion transport system, permease component [Gottschalkia purinilytica]
MLDSTFWINWSNYFTKIIYPSIGTTIKILFACMILGVFFGFLLAIALVMYGPLGLRPRKKIYGVLNFIVNTICSFPMIILIVALSPITKMIVGTTIGEKAAIFPITLAATPYIARIIENIFIGVNRQLIEAARSFGASDMQIIFRIMLKESVPSLISSLTLSTISYLGTTTLAGAVGAGGLGAVALNYGYQSFNNTVLYTSVIILFFMVLIIQRIGSELYKKSLK